MSARLRERRLARALAARAQKPSDPHPLAKFADKAHDLDLVRKSVDDAASVSAGLWLSYLFALFYVGIAVGGVTHKDLLLENPVRLPFLNVELPFVAFFALAPVLFVVSHAYTLMHFVLLASKVGAYNTELAKQIPELDAATASTHDGAHALDHREIRRGLRRQLPSNIFVQFLAGPFDIRDGGLGWLLKTIAWISLVIGPVSLLLLIQVQFLPYHLEWVTWIQRLAVLVDITLLWLLWPAVLGGRSELRWPRLWRHPVAALASLAVAALALVVARYPGEWVDAHAGHMRWIPPSPRLAWHDTEDWRRLADAWLGQPGWTSVHDLLFNGEVDDVTRRRKSLFSNTLVLPEFDGLAAAGISDPKQLAGIRHSLVLRGRHLKGAVLAHADLRKADLEWAKLEGANLVGAQLQDVVLARANLQGALLTGAQLQGVLLEFAELQGANLVVAQLQGATLTGARLQDVVLARANLQGALLAGAQLQGASLDRTQLQGASLETVQLEGGSLTGAQLQAASLNGAQLQGAMFGQSIFAGTDISGTAIWRTDFEGVSWGVVLADDLKERPISIEEFAALKAGILNEVPEDQLQHRVLQRIEKLNPETIGDPGSAAIQKQVLEGARADEGAYRKALAGELEALACSARNSADYIVRGLITSQRIADVGPFKSKLVERVLAPTCSVSAALTNEDKARLKELAKDGQADESKQQ